MTELTKFKSKIAMVKCNNRCAQNLAILIQSTECNMLNHTEYMSPMGYVVNNGTCIRVLVLCRALLY